MTSYIYDFNGYPLRLLAEGADLVSCKWATQESPDALQSDKFHCGAPNEHTVIDTAITQLNEYRAGKRKQFELPLRLRGTDFQMRVWDELGKIPYGTTISYGMLARCIGSPKSCRAVANACGANPFAVIIPCHRVTGASRRIGGYTGGVDIKLALLNLELPAYPFQPDTT